MSNPESVKANLILDRFTQANLRLSTLVLVLRNEKNDHLSCLKKTISTIKDHVVDSLHFFLKKKIVSEI